MACRFPGATSDDDRDKRRTGAGGDSGPVVGPRSGVIDPDRVYFGPRKTAAVSRNDLFYWASLDSGEFCDGCYSA